MAWALPATAGLNALGEHKQPRGLQPRQIIRDDMTVHIAVYMGENAGREM